jgi:hypothetical protein
MRSQIRVLPGQRSRQGYQEETSMMQQELVAIRLRELEHSAEQYRLAATYAQKPGSTTRHVLGTLGVLFVKVGTKLKQLEAQGAAQAA